MCAGPDVFFQTGWCQPVWLYTSVCEYVFHRIAAAGLYGIMIREVFLVEKLLGAHRSARLSSSLMDMSRKLKGKDWEVCTFEDDVHFMKIVC